MTQPAPSKELVSETVQNIFQKAKNKVLERNKRSEDINQLATSLPPARPLKTMTFRYATSGTTFQVLLHDRQNCINHIQDRALGGELRRSIIKAFIPGIPEPLSNKQDLRHLLPNIPELEIVVSDCVATPAPIDEGPALFEPRLTAARLARFNAMMHGY